MALYISGTCNMQQVTNCYTNTHTYTISKIQTCILSLSVKQCSSLVMIFFMNVKTSLPVICHNGKIHVLVCVQSYGTPPQTDTSCYVDSHSECTNRHQVRWLQEVLDCMSLTEQKHCSSQNTCPVWHKVTSGQGHETACCMWECMPLEALVMYWCKNRNPCS